MWNTSIICNRCCKTNIYSKIDEEKIEEIINNVFDFRPSNIIKELDLKKPIYKKTAAYGHFGQKDFNWEKTDKVEAIKNYIK